ncbi:hypothetical protein QBC39DRAFT_402817 [Podospora conica]|nr:hypothetical protein QBC39DRAFT_402817 [Schizothecium conicum]
MYDPNPEIYGPKPPPPYCNHDPAPRHNCDDDLHRSSTPLLLPLLVPLLLHLLLPLACRHKWNWDDLCRIPTPLPLPNPPSPSQPPTTWTDTFTFTWTWTRDNLLLLPLPLLLALACVPPLAQISLYWLRRALFSWRDPPAPYIPRVLRSPWSGPWAVTWQRLRSGEEGGRWGVRFLGVAGGGWWVVRGGLGVVPWLGVVARGVGWVVLGVLGVGVVGNLVGVMGWVAGVVGGVLRGVGRVWRGVVVRGWGVVGEVWRGVQWWVVMVLVGFLVVMRFPVAWGRVVAGGMGVVEGVLMGVADGLREWAPGVEVEGVAVLRVIERVGGETRVVVYYV